MLYAVTYWIEMNINEYFCARRYFHTDIGQTEIGLNKIFSTETQQNKEETEEEGKLYQWSLYGKDRIHSQLHSAKLNFWKREENILWSWHHHLVRCGWKRRVLSIWKKESATLTWTKREWAWKLSEATVTTPLKNRWLNDKILFTVTSLLQSAGHI